MTTQPGRGDEGMARQEMSDRDWNAWATLCNDLSDGLIAAMEEGCRPLFSARRKAAEHLWAAGYRPTQEAVDRVVERQRLALPHEPTQ